MADRVGGAVDVVAVEAGCILLDDLLEHHLQLLVGQSADGVEQSLGDTGGAERADDAGVVGDTSLCQRVREHLVGDPAQQELVDAVILEQRGACIRLTRVGCVGPPAVGASCIQRHRCIQSTRQVGHESCRGEAGGGHIGCQRHVVGVGGVLDVLNHAAQVKGSHGGIQLNHLVAAGHILTEKQHITGCYVHRHGQGNCNSGHLILIIPIILWRIGKPQFFLSFIK